MTIERDRAAIDKIDDQILALLNQRAKLAAKIGAKKRRSAKARFSPARERQIFDRLVAANAGPLPDDALVGIYREIIAANRQLEMPATVAYLGPAGTFTHMAVLRKFGARAQARPADSIPDVFREVEKGVATFGVVPMENSTEGVINDTLDMFAESSLDICAETYLDVDHYLLARSSIEEITRIYSMRQPLAQCRVWIKTNLPRAELQEVASTARAAEFAAKEPSSAAIGTRLAAGLYDLTIIGERIQDSPHNRTRFLVVGQAAAAEPSGRDKTSIMFSVRHQAGSLYRALAVLDKYDINMTMIESRPTKQTPWEYVFFVDVQGHISEPAVARALDMLGEQTLFVRVLGSYPEAE
ncbi:MAG: prephenate dehydratase [Armatimonadota bacterium]|nr:MAG: prephenate dehydratase [Armatimonadota bacterium]